MNWMCPVDGNVEVWESPIAALSHVYNMRGRGHAEPDSIVRSDDEFLFPEPTDEDPNMNTVVDELEQYPFLPNDVESMLRDLEEEGWETPPVLTEFDSEAFDIFQTSSGIQNDIEQVEKELDYIDKVVSSALRNVHDMGGGHEQTDVDEDEEEPEESVEVVEPDTSGYSTADVKEAEEDEVMRLLRRSTFLDQHSDDVIDVFEIVYKERDSEGVHVSEVSSDLGVPDGMVEENLEILTDKNLVEWNSSDDIYYVPY